MQTANRLFKLIPAALMVVLGIAACKTTSSSDIEVNDLDYFETRGVNVLVFNNPFSGGFNDEKDSGIELIHHGVRTAQGGAIRLSNTPEQWDLVPDMTSKTVNKEDNSIEVGLRFPDFDFDSRIVVTGKGKAVEIAVYLDKPVPEELVGDAGLNLEFQPAEYWLKTFIMDGKPNRFPRYAVSNTIINARVVNMATIKPIDRDLVIESAKKTGVIVTAEEHNVIGGLGSAVAEVVCETVPVPVLRVGVEDTFGKSGPAVQLLHEYGLDAANIVAKCKAAVALKK